MMLHFYESLTVACNIWTCSSLHVVHAIDCCHHHWMCTFVIQSSDENNSSAQNVNLDVRMKYIIAVDYTCLHAQD